MPHTVLGQDHGRLVDTTGEPPRSIPTGARRAVRGGIFGNYVDQFDIFLPVIALAPAAGHLFGTENLVSNAGLIFVATLLGRPIGAAVFGPVSDRVGRTVTTKFALAGIALTMLLIALVPSHAVLGAGTFWIVLVLRLLGGIFLGGEYTSAIPLAMEWSQPRRRGLASGLIMWMSPWANATIAGLVFVLLGVLDIKTYSAWGWRIPFLLGSLMAFGMLIYYRSYIADSPSWKQAAKRTNPLREIFVGEHRGALAQVFILMSGMWLFVNMAIPVLTGQLKADVHLSAQTVSFVMMCATAVSAFTMAGCGHLSTLIGRRTFFAGFGLIAAILAPITYLAIFSVEGTTGLVLVVVALQVVTVSVYGPVGAYLAERFPTAVRSSGYGMSYSLSIVLPTLYPYYLPPLQDVFGRHGAIAILLILAGVLVAAGALSGPETSRVRDLR
jgi:MFS family permease